MSVYLEFDGEGHKISNFYSLSVANTGFFGTTFNGKVSRVKFEDVYMIGNNNGVISTILNGTVEQVGVSGYIEGMHASSIAEEGSGYVANAYSTATLNGQGHSACGILMYAGSSKIENCHFEGILQSGQWLSSIRYSGSNPINCYSSRDGDDVSNISTFENWSISETKGADTIWYLDKEKGYPVFQWE